MRGGGGGTITLIHVPLPQTNLSEIDLRLKFGPEILTCKLSASTLFTYMNMV